jgi:hypothetical protein
MKASLSGLPGQSPVTARHIRSKPITFLPEFKLWFQSNYEPVIKGQDLGIWRRVKRIPWNYTVPDAEKDERLPSKLRAEAPGILNWALRGLAVRRPRFAKGGRSSFPPARGGTESWEQDGSSAARDPASTGHIFHASASLGSKSDSCLTMQNRWRLRSATLFSIASGSTPRTRSSDQRYAASGPALI